MDTDRGLTVARRRKQPAPPPGDDPKEVGERWRGEMREDRETLPALVWKRVFHLHRIDLADPRQASALQVYRLLYDVMDLCGTPPPGETDAGVNVSVVELEAFVDAAVPRVFRKRR